MLVRLISREVKDPGLDIGVDLRDIGGRSVKYDDPQKALLVVKSQILENLRPNSTSVTDDAHCGD
jgi:hypothetical protein